MKLTTKGKRVTEIRETERYKGRDTATTTQAESHRNSARLAHFIPENYVFSTLESFSQAWSTRTYILLCLHEKLKKLTGMRVRRKEEKGEKSKKKKKTKGGGGGGGTYGRGDEAKKTM